MCVITISMISMMSQYSKLAWIYLTSYCCMFISFSIFIAFVTGVSRQNGGAYSSEEPGLTSLIENNVFILIYQLQKSNFNSFTLLFGILVWTWNEMFQVCTSVCVKCHHIQSNARPTSYYCSCIVFFMIALVVTKYLLSTLSAFIFYR